MGKRPFALQTTVLVPSFPDAFAFAVYIIAFFPDFSVFIIIDPLAVLQSFFKIAPAAEGAVLVVEFPFALLQTFH